MFQCASWSQHPAKVSPSHSSSLASNISELLSLHSLQNMYKELSSDIEGFKSPDHGYLMGWAKQGERNSGLSV